MGVFLLWLVILCVIIGSNLSREKKKNQDRNLNRPADAAAAKNATAAADGTAAAKNAAAAADGTATAKYATAENAGMAEKLWCIQTRH